MSESYGEYAMRVRELGQVMDRYKAALERMDCFCGGGTGLESLHSDNCPAGIARKALQGD